ncbi:MAG: hypothetical protein J6C15_06875 [Bacteroidaceae bacterium]|nr:hypothetical protein [Bacteroidaceae bacterium]
MAKIRINEREISSSLEYLSQRVKYLLGEAIKLVQGERKSKGPKSTREDVGGDDLQQG